MQITFNLQGTRDASGNESNTMKFYVIEEFPVPPPIWEYEPASHTHPEPLH